MFCNMGMLTICALVVAASLPITSAGTTSSTGIFCEDVANLGVLEGELDLGTKTSIECPANEDREYMSEILVESGRTLILKSTQPLFRFMNVRFTLEEGASLIFDMPETTIGPNHEENDVPPGEVFALYDKASLTFMGDFRADSISNAGSLFSNEGDSGISIEFKGDSFFTNNRCNIFDRNNGSLKFRGEALFEANDLLGITNYGEEGFVRFSKTATFIDTGDGFDGAIGCGLSNRWDSAVRFYGKAYFNDNINNGASGGAFVNSGDLVFRGAVQLNRNTATYAGGFVNGGSTTFKKRVTMKDNGAQENGGAFSLAGGTVTFERPDKVSASGNYIYGGQISGGVVQVATGCSLAFVEADAEDDSTLVGFPFEDVCQEMTV